MSAKHPSAHFTDRIRLSHPEGSTEPWAFSRVPPDVSKSVLRRGRMTAVVSVGAVQFGVLMEPDGQLGHWFKWPAEQWAASGLTAGEPVSIQIKAPVAQPEPALPASFAEALAAHADALEVWQKTTVLARIDWVHWMESAKQEQTRQSRASDAIDMLRNGKRRVCCFDPSGFYSKALTAPPEVSA